MRWHAYLKIYKMLSAGINEEPLILILTYDTSMRKKAILYHTNWANYASNFQVKDIRIQAVDDIAYAFFNIKDSGNGNWIVASGDMYVRLVISVIHI